MHSEDRNTSERTAAAREAARAKLEAAGKNSRQVGQEKALAALTWIYRWGWSTPTVVDLVAGSGRRGLCSRLEKRGLLTSHPTPSGSGLKGVPASVAVLTEDGVAEVEAVLADQQIMPYPTHPERDIPWRQLRHDVLVQLWTARRLTDGKITGYRTPRELAGRPSASLVKQPDAVWRLPGGQAAAVELELTAKKDRELHQAALSLINAIRPAETGEKGPFDLVAILSHSQAILDRWRRMLTPGTTLTLYKREASRHWKPDGKAKVPDWVRGHIILQKIELW